MLYSHRLVVLATFLVLCLGSHQQLFGQRLPIRLQLDGKPAEMSGSLPAAEQGRDTTTAQDTSIGGRPIVRLTDVSKATVEFSPAARQSAVSPVILVLPGGGYQVLAEDLEGTEICHWLNSVGIATLQLRYRVPTSIPHAEPLEDARQALELLHRNAEAWDIDRNRIGVIGFSAGADLAARLTLATPGEFTAQMLIYPAYLWDKDQVRLRPDVEPSTATSPTFLIQAEDDPIGAYNSLHYYEALMELHIPAELHLYANGGHGYGMRVTGAAVTHWRQLADIWLRNLGFEKEGEQ